MELFTEEELKEAKERVLQRAEERLTNEVIDGWRRGIQREVSKRVLEKISPQLEEQIRATFTKERIDQAIADTIKTKTSGYYHGDSFIEKELRNGIQRVVDAHADAISKEIKNLLYVALRENFFEKKDAG